MLAVVAVAVLRVLGLVAVWNYDVGKIKQQPRACFETSKFAEKGEGHQVGEKGFEVVVSVLLLFLAEQELA